jgi:hypothetical protein
MGFSGKGACLLLQFSLVETRSLRRKLTRCLTSQAAVRAFFVVLLSPGCDLPPRIERVLEPTYVRALFSQPSIEALDMRILRGLSGLNVQQFDLPLHASRQEVPAGQLRTGRSGSPTVVRATICSNTRVTLRLAKLLSTSKAKHSLVYASIRVSTRMVRPHSAPAAVFLPPRNASVSFDQSSAPPRDRLVFDMYLPVSAM